MTASVSYKAFHLYPTGKTEQMKVNLARLNEQLNQSAHSGFN